MKFEVGQQIVLAIMHGKRNVPAKILGVLDDALHVKTQGMTCFVKLCEVLRNLFIEGDGNIGTIGKIA